jgi:hypothetical protein
MAGHQRRGARLLHFSVKIVGIPDALGEIR